MYPIITLTVPEASTKTLVTYGYSSPSYNLSTTHGPFLVYCYHAKNKGYSQPLPPHNAQYPYNGILYSIHILHHQKTINQKTPTKRFRTMEQFKKNHPALSNNTNLIDRNTVHNKRHKNKTFYRNQLRIEPQNTQPLHLTFPNIHVKIATYR